MRGRHPARPVATVRFAGPDRYWDGCHDFGRLSAREARRTQPARIAPRRDELGTFATLISRFVHLPPGYQEALRVCVPRTSSTSCDQAIFVNHAIGASLSLYAVLLQIDRFG